ncbi:MBL fold metallo-hydrolase [Arachidicoccus ginsenosidimutans]|uniref:MBL fold metallo-hydrolase n=1 Tax=Arachidicoccus sp. BS20 TaxID=1850526 RepID=UPI000AE89517|nr:3',5'-cyclic-nucleotide phosphodiesterase [Arachidicoccus sp. BS20]
MFFCIIVQYSNAQSSFTILPLGVYGGSDESNLSAYLLAPRDSQNYICLDAGTIYDGLKAAHSKGFIKKNEADFFKENIKAYLISHGHLDHVAGMIINSPNDVKKNIYALPFCIDILKTKYFTWTSWANFANEGEQPALKKYTYNYLDTSKETLIENTSLFVKPFLLSHSAPGKSTAFLIRNNDDYFLYFGDTGDDAIEQSNNLKIVWNAVAPLLPAKKLKGISIECSYPDEQNDKQLFGHLKPDLLFKNLKELENLAGKNSLQNFPVIIAHIKPDGDNETLIHEELEKENTLNVKLIFPKQGEKINL